MKTLWVVSSFTILATLLSFSQKTQAELYLGFAAGSTDYGTIAKDVSSLELSSGFRFNQSFGVEASWLELGEADIPIYGVGGNEISRANFGVDGASLSFLTYFPLADTLDLFARFGLYLWDQESSHVTTSNLIRSNNQQENDADIIYGGGIIWQVVDNIGFRVQYQAIDVAGENIENISAGLTFAF